MWLSFLFRPIIEEMYMTQRVISMLREEVSALREVIQKLVEQRASGEGSEQEIVDVTAEVREIREQAESLVDEEEFDPSAHGVPKE